MTHPGGRSPTLLLVGSGHAHLFVLEALARGRLGGARVAMVSPEPFHVYSGMLTGLIGGLYADDEVRLNIEEIARAAGATFIAGRVVAIRADDCRVELEDGTPVGYEVLSIAVGSVAAAAEPEGVETVPLKPIDGAGRLVPVIERLARERSSPSIIVSGGGAAGVEVALNIRTRLRLAGSERARVTLVERGPRLLADHSVRATRLAALALAKQQVETRIGTEIVATADGTARLSDGRALPADLIVRATGAVALVWPEGSDLEADERGFVLVDDRLRSVSHPNVYASGDAAGVLGHLEMPKTGVFSVRQGPILWHNLAVSLGAGGTLRRFQPQRRSLALLNTGDGRAIFSWGVIAIRARWVLALKDRIDRRFMRRFGRVAEREHRETRASAGG